VQVLTGQRDSETMYTLKRIHQSNLLVNGEMLWFIMNFCHPQLLHFARIG